VRGGRNLPADILRGTSTHLSGVTGVSVECALGLPVAELATTIPHGQIGVTTVRAIRQAVVMSYAPLAEVPIMQR
jgi:hypothetical protein